MNLSFSIRSGRMGGSYTLYTDWLIKVGLLAKLDTFERLCGSGFRVRRSPENSYSQKIGVSGSLRRRRSCKAASTLKQIEEGKYWFLAPRKQRLGSLGAGSLEVSLSERHSTDRILFEWLACLPYILCRLMHILMYLTSFVHSKAAAVFGPALYTLPLHPIALLSVSPQHVR